jgi:hypothetical protein
VVVAETGVSVVGMRPGSVGSDLSQALIAWWRSAIGEVVAGSGEWSSAALNLGLAGLAGLRPVVAAASVTEGMAELHSSVAKAALQRLGLPCLVLWLILRIGALQGVGV